MFDKRKLKVILILVVFLLFTLPLSLASASLDNRTNHQIAFNKVLPINGTTTLNFTSLSWALSPGAARYEYCFDTINNASCDTSWISTTNVTVNLTGLANASYYWQVRAIAANGTIVYANNGTWWVFYVNFVPTPTPTVTKTATLTRTPTITLTPTSTRSPFGKAAPPNNITFAGSFLTMRWFSYDGAVTYEYCLDTSNNNSCDTSWVSTGSTKYAQVSLTNNTTYYWQIRAITASNQVVYPSEGWWTFSVQS